jgi:hypothetical protein
MELTPSRGLNIKHRTGVATLVLVVVLVLVIIVAGVVYVFTLSGSGSKTSTQTSGGSATSTTTSTQSTTITFSAATSLADGSQSFKTYKGTFSYSNPLGPGGERVLSNNTVQSYTSVQVASGSFTFFINPANFTGVGSGQGTMTVTTTGFCSGSTTFPYTFRVTNANDLLNGNITFAVGVPTPINFTVTLHCTGPMSGVNIALNNPSPFLSIYPNLISVHTVPITVSEHLTGNITYQYTITPTS